MTDILEVIKERHSSRGQFDSKRIISKDNLNLILEAARWAPTAHNMQNFEIIVIDDKDIIKKISKIESITSEEELKEKKVGILGTQFPPKWRDASKIDEAIKERTPTPLNYTIRGGNTILLVIYDKRKRAPASEGDVLGFLSLGCIMENIWLMAQALDINVHIMSAFNGVKNDIWKLFNIPDFMEFGFACKLGYTLKESEDHARVRREIQSFTHHNRYGNKEQA